jgi:hypothetical protein
LLGTPSSANPSANLFVGSLLGHEIVNLVNETSIPHTKNRKAIFGQNQLGRVAGPSLAPSALRTGREGFPFIRLEHSKTPPLNYEEAA